MASIVYDGAGGGGDLFKDMKFFIVQRVPLRTTWIELIQVGMPLGSKRNNFANFATVEWRRSSKIERHADILIADDARHDTPPEFVSWKFIDLSVKAGRLVDIEKYRHVAPVNATRERGSASAQPAKSTRTPFTDADDRLLTRWVLKAERMGRSTKGNQLYIELAALYPHHTYQSWLDHWKKHLLPRHKAGHLHYETEGDSPSPERELRPVRRGLTKPPATQSSHTRGQAAAPEERVSVDSSSSIPKHSTSLSSRPALSQASSSKAKIRKPIAGRPFIEDDNRLLRNEFDDICDIDSEKESAAWEAWTEIHGRHTAQEWKNYFHNDFCPQELKAREQKRPAKMKPVLSTASRDSSSPPKYQHTKTHTPRKDSTHNFEKSLVDDAIRSPSAPIDNARSEVGHESKTSGVRSLNIDLEKRPYTNSLLKEEEYFTSTLKDFSGSSAGGLNFYPKIRGKEFSIFKLWQIVMLFGGFEKTNFENRWKEIADRLSFPIANRAEAAEDLKNCYDKILSEFETLLVEAADDEDNPEFSASQEETLINSQLDDTISRSVQRALGHEEETEDDEEILELPPPLTRSKRQSILSPKKRAIDSDDLSDHSELSTTKVKTQSKRQKIDKGKGKEDEIPSTPEHIFNATVSHHSSPLKNQLDVDNDNSSSDREACERILRIQLKNPGGSSREASARKPIVEPETQDFSIASPTPAPKKITACNVIDLSQDSSTESESESESEPEPEPKSKTKPNPNPKPKPEPEPKSESDSDSQNSFAANFNKYVALGYSKEIVAKALDATTMNFEIASVVMERLKKGQSIPYDMPGVWTQRDDGSLSLKEGSTSYMRLMEKHGKEGIAARKQFKNLLNEVRGV